MRFVLGYCRWFGSIFLKRGISPPREMGNFASSPHRKISIRNFFNIHLNLIIHEENLFTPVAFIGLCVSASLLHRGQGGRCRTPARCEQVEVELIQTGMLNTGSKASARRTCKPGYVITSDAEWLDVDKPTGKGRVSVTLEAKPQ